MAGSQRVPAALSQAALKTRSSLFLCRSCRRQLQSPPRPNAHQVRHAMTPFTKSLRKKIWGTDNPPGLEDPYGPSWAERRQEKLEREAHAKRRVNLTVEERIAEDALDGIQQSGPTRLEVGDHELNEPFEDDPDLDRDYKPADTWDGLEHIGHRGDWRDMEPRTEDQYYSWMRSHSEPPWTREQLVSSLHQAVVETLIMAQVTNATPRYLASIDPADYTIEISENGSLEGALQKVVSRPSQRRQFASKESEHEIAELADEPISEMSADDTASVLAADEMQNEALGAEAERVMEETASVDESFLAADLDIASPLTFKIIKRFQHLTSRRLADPFLNSLFSHTRQPSTSPVNVSSPSSAADAPFSRIIDHVFDLQKPRPKNLYEELVEKPKLVLQGNLMILPRRETPVDKEKEVGRWKVIERELRARGLPVLGKLEAQQN